MSGAGARGVNPVGQAKRTVPVLKAAGLSWGSTGNLRQGPEALGDSSYADVSMFQRIVNLWSKEVRAKYRS